MIQVKKVKPPAFQPGSPDRMENVKLPDISQPKSPTLSMERKSENESITARS
jgi:hypothetical protein